MPRYFFHLRSGASEERDDVGLDLPDIDDVHREAGEAAKDVTLDLVAQSGAGTDLRFVIQDENGRTLMEYPIRQAVKGQ